MFKTDENIQDKKKRKLLYFKDALSFYSYHCETMSLKWTLHEISFLWPLGINIVHLERTQVGMRPRQLFICQSSTFVSKSINAEDDVGTLGRIKL